MRHFLILLIIGFSFTNGNAQELLSKDFRNSFWFSNNENEDFYKSDTLTICKMIRYSTSYKTLSKEHIIMYYNNGKDTETLNFQKNDKFDLFELSFQFCQPLRGMEKWTWKFNEVTQILNLYADNKLKSSFKILETKEEKQNWNREIEAGKVTEFETEIVFAKIKRL